MTIKQWCIASSAEKTSCRGDNRAGTGAFKLEPCEQWRLWLGERGTSMNGV
jgi:hypothetical protein